MTLVPVVMRYGIGSLLDVNDCFMSPFSLRPSHSSNLPSALSMTLLSILIVAGMVRISLYPLAAAAIASPMPVLPEVGSTSTVTPEF